MRHLIWLETKAILRRPTWIFLVAFSAWIFFTGLFAGKLTPEISLGLDHPFLGPAQGLFSLGEWGRAILLSLEMFGGILFCSFTALIAVSPLYSEIAHREVLWSTVGAGKIRLVGAKLIAVGSTATFLLALGAGAFFLNPATREIIVAAGGQYIPIYLVLAWLRVLLWVALAMFFFYLTRSRWTTIGIVTALQVAWFGVAGFWGAPNVRILLHRNFLAWDFIGPFSPLGLIPPVFFLQVGIILGIIFVLTGVMFLLRRRFPEWTGVKSITAEVVLILGIILAVGGGGVTAWKINNHIAPFTATALWERKILFAKPYIWSKDGILLVYPGTYMSVRLPTRENAPAWIGELTGVRKVRRYDMGQIILTGHLGSNNMRTGSQSLTLLYPPDCPYSPELEGAVRQLREEIQPLVKRAQLWEEGTPELTVLWPNDFFLDSIIYYLPGKLLIPYSSLSKTMLAKQWEAAWALSEGSGLDKPTRAYLSLYLMAGVDKEEVNRTLEKLRLFTEGKIRYWWPHPPFYRYVRDHEATMHILQDWQKGETIGHANFINSLLRRNP